MMDKSHYNAALVYCMGAVVLLFISFRKSQRFQRIITLAVSVWQFG